MFVTYVRCGLIIFVEERGAGLGEVGDYTTKFQRGATNAKAWSSGEAI